LYHKAPTIISLDDEMSPNKIPKDKRVKYSGTKKSNSDLIIENFFDAFKNDIHYAKKAPLWTAQVLRFRHTFFPSYFELFDKGSGISRIDGDKDEDFGTNNDKETAPEREIWEETEWDQARILECI